jgi:hypothetical protein
MTIPVIHTTHQPRQRIEERAPDIPLQANLVEELTDSYRLERSTKLPYRAERDPAAQ